MSQSALGKVRHILFRAAARPVHYFLDQTLRDDDTHSWLLHTMGNENAMNDAGIEEFVPGGIENIGGFEDCAWLYSSNPLNHGVSRLRFDEAAYLFRFVKSLPSPHVAEIGRYKGGTTFLLVAAGASVVSLDNGRVPGQEALNDSLKNVLEFFNLRERCVTEIADALDYPVHPEEYDMVFLDIGLDDGETTRKIFERWWGTVKRGGCFLFRDGKDTVLTDAARYVGSLRDTEFSAALDFDLPGSFVLCAKR